VGFVPYENLVGAEIVFFGGGGRSESVRLTSLRMAADLRWADPQSGSLENPPDLL
jgi:hypothetical protein